MKKKCLVIFILLFLFSVASAQAIGVRDNVKVSWKGKWYDAVIIQQNETNFKIHYIGYDNCWDEWVRLNRIRFAVLWQGKWYPATMLAISGNLVKIHYTGYDNSWDEWVGLDRIQGY